MVATARKKRRASEPQDYPAAAAGTLRRDNAVAHIRKLIVSMKLGVGDRLPGERQLAAKFNLSRGTVREALQFLAALNLVEIRHGGGCFLRASSGENKEVRAEWRDWVARNPGRPAGTPISDEDMDQPSLGRITVPLRGRTMTHGASAHSLWVLQRALRWLTSLSAEDRRACDELAAEIGAGDLLAIELARPLTRVGNRLAVA